MSRHLHVLVIRDTVSEPEARFACASALILRAAPASRSRERAPGSFVPMASLGLGPHALSLDEKRTGESRDGQGRLSARNAGPVVEEEIVRGDDRSSRYPPRGVWFGLILAAGTVRALLAQDVPDEDDRAHSRTPSCWPRIG